MWNTWPARDRHAPRGYLYVLRFSSGAVKVGATQSPRERARTHAADAARYGLTITGAWLSPAHAGHAATERALLAELPRLGRMLASEYVEAPFAEVVAAARRIDYPAVPATAAQATRIERARADRDERIRRAYAEAPSVRRVAESFGVSKSLVARVVGQ